ncbi:Sucrose-6-phosphate hydrolase [compost metagenome]
MIVGSRVNDTGQVRLYRSADLHEWHDEGILAEADKEMGYMWECPDFFTLNGKRMLMFSPQGLAADGYKHRNLFQSGYLLGEWQPGQPFSHDGQFIEIDYGHDFYAPQSFLTPDNRRIIIGWLDMWQSPMPEQQDGWAGMLSLPRELSLREDNRLLIKPAAEVIALRGNYYPVSEHHLNNQKVFVTSDAKAVEILLEWELHSSNAEQYGIALGDGLRIYVDCQDKRLKVERNYPMLSLEGVRSVVLPASDTLSLRIFIDHSSVEVFVNDGESCLSSRIYPQQEHRDLVLFSNNGDAYLKGAGYWVLDK